MTKTPIQTPEFRSIDICICTFRRQHILKTLMSLNNLHLDKNWRVNVIVADNDETPSAQAEIANTVSDLRLPVHYVHAPARNISIARNACLEASKADLIAFIDDDELVTPAWLQELVARMDDVDADVVLGPVKAIYPPNCPDWIVSGDFHSIQPVFITDEIRTGYSCNVLFKRAHRQQGTLRFDDNYGRTGGEDTLFFSSLYEAGARFSYAPSAIINEEVAASRLNMTWLIKRWFRSGQTHATLVLRNATSPVLSRIGLGGTALCKTAFCWSVAALTVWSSVRWHYWLLRGILHVGVISRILGKQELVQYG